MNKELWKELIKSAHPHHRLPDGALDAMCESPFFSAAPCVLFPLASESTCGFSIFMDRMTTQELIDDYAHRYDLDHRGIDDALAYRGRGLFSNSFIGKSEYNLCGKDIGVDLLKSPELVTQDGKVMIQVADWQLKELICNQRLFKRQSLAAALGIHQCSCFTPKRRIKRMGYMDYKGLAKETLLEAWIEPWL